MNAEDQKRLIELTKRPTAANRGDPKVGLIKAMFEAYGEDTGQDMRIPGHSSLPDDYIPLLESIVGEREEEPTTEPLDIRFRQVRSGRQDEPLIFPQPGDKPFATIAEIWRDAEGDNGIEPKPPVRYDE